MSMFSIKNVFASKPQTPVKKTPEEIQQEIKNVKQQIKQEQKALEDCKILINLYEKANDVSGLEQTKKAMEDMEKKIEELKQKKEDLKNELPPRPLPQLEFVSNPTQNSKTETTTSPSLMAPPPKLDLSEVQQFLSKQQNETSQTTSAQNINSQQPSHTHSEKDNKIKYAIVLWDFPGNQEDELAVKSKELVTVIQTYGYEEADVDWWRIRNSSGQEGFVPSNYLEAVDESGRKSATLTLPKVNLPFEAIALYDYAATKPDELSFYYGDFITITKMDYPGWWTGEINGTRGMLPSNYVQKLSAEEKAKIIQEREAASKAQEEAAQPNEEETTEPVAAQPTAPAPVVVEVPKHPSYGEAVYDYVASRDDELVFQKGDILRILSKQMNGWYKGYIFKAPSTNPLPKGASMKQETKLIPSNYIVEITEQQAIEKAEALEKKKQLPKRLSRPINKPLPIPKPKSNPASPATTVTNTTQTATTTATTQPPASTTSQPSAATSTTSTPATSTASPQQAENFVAAKERIKNLEQQGRLSVYNPQVPPPQAAQSKPDRTSYHNDYRRVSSDNLAPQPTATRNENEPLLGSTAGGPQDKSCCCTIL